MGGLNNYGQLGDGTVTSRVGFVEVITSGAKAVSSGANHGMVLKQDGSLWAAGNNGNGQLGDKTKTDRHTWVKVVEECVKEASTGDDHSVFLNDKNELCFTGLNSNGQLGTGDTTQVQGFKCRPRPGPIIKPGAITGPSAGTQRADYQYTTVVGEDGNLYATGYNGHGAFGDGTKTARTNFKRAFLSDVKTATGGYYFIAAVKKDGSLWASGYNAYGQLGDGTKSHKLGFVKAIGNGVVHVSVGYRSQPRWSARGWYTHPQS